MIKNVIVIINYNNFNLKKNWIELEFLIFKNWLIINKDFKNSKFFKNNFQHVIVIINYNHFWKI